MNEERTAITVQKEARMARLPKWAQLKIEKLGRDLRDIQDEMRALGRGSTRVWSGYKGRLAEDVYNVIHVPTDYPVCFNTTKGIIEVKLGSKLGDVEVRGYDGPLVVVPHASNSVSINLVPPPRRFVSRKGDK